jgi:hypothetical protein
VRSHWAANCLLAPITRASWAGSEGSSSVAKKVSSCGPFSQFSAGWLAPAPRGSKPTMSNRASTAAGNSRRAPSAYCTPDPPGPPGLMTSAPTRCAGSAAGSLTTGRVNRGPSGLA